jgi:hypothetical protein
MSYIGNAPISAAFLTDTFSGNGSTVAFTMTVAPANTSSIIVAITGVLQDPSTYSVSGTTLTFSAAPPSGTSNISVRYLGIPASGVTTTAYRTVTNFTATAGQTSFSVPSYTVGYIDVYRNGVRLVSTDYTATTGTTVVLNNACTSGDSVVTESFLVSSVLNAIPATAGSVSDSYIVGMSASKLTGSRTIPKGTMPAGTILQTVYQAYTPGNISTSTTGSFVDAGIAALSITPTSSNSIIRIGYYNVGGHRNTNGPGNGGSYYTIYRNIGGGAFSNLGDATYGITNNVLSFGTLTDQNPINYEWFDSPATTSAVTYKPYYKVYSTSGYFSHAGYGSVTFYAVAQEIAV